MNFNTSTYFKRATSRARAKSDVANKLISMLLHEVSRRIVSDHGLSVTDEAYINSVVATFGNNCAYCGRDLEHDRAAIEHLDGINRFRAGFHIPGNVIIACLKCNREKRRDDQLKKLELAQTGWGSFLSHDSTRCVETCKTCAYWKTIWPNTNERIENLRKAYQRIEKFRALYPQFIQSGLQSKQKIEIKLESLYRESQNFAVSQIQAAADIFSKELKSE